MGIGRPRLVGATVGDLSFKHNQGRPLAFLTRRIQCRRNRLEIVSIFDGLHMPMISLKPLLHIFGKRDCRTALDGDPVVVIQYRQTPQAEMTGQGGGLGGKPLHEIPVATHDIGIVIHDSGIRKVETGRQVALRHGHPHRIGNSLAKRARSGFDPRGMTILRMPGRLAAPLPEVFKIIEAHIIAGEIKQTVEQHRGVTARKHKPIPIGPQGVCRIVLQILRPEDVGPELAFWIASMESVRMVLMHIVSRFFGLADPPSVILMFSLWLSRHR